MSSGGSLRSMPQSSPRMQATSTKEICESAADSAVSTKKRGAVAGNTGGAEGKLEAGKHESAAGSTSADGRVARRMEETADIALLDFDLIDITVGYSNKSTKKLGEKDVLKVTLENHSEVTIPEQRIILRPNMYYRYAMAVIPEVAAHKEVSVELEVHVKEPGTRRIVDLCQSFDIHFQNFDKTVITETKIANYNQGLGDYCPQTLLERAGKDPNEIRHYNILLFGVAGACKSSFINTLLTMLQDEDKRGLSRVAVTGGGAQHATQKITCYDVKQVHPYVHFNLWDTWGLNRNNYDAYQVSLLMQGKLPSGWTMHSDFDKYADRFERLLKKETLFTQMHAVLFFVPQGSLTDLEDEDVTRIRQIFQCLIQEECNPLVILSKVDEVVWEVREDPFSFNEEIEKIKITASHLFQIGLSSIRYTVNYLDETSRNWKIEAMAHQNLTAALETCESFVEGRLMRFGKVGARGVVDEDGLVWPDETF